MRKVRWGSILLAVAMLLTLLTVTALADGTVKSEVELRNAIEAETEDTITITLGADIELNAMVSIPSHKSIIINGGGHTISYSFNGKDGVKCAFTGSAAGSVEGIPAGVTLTVNNVVFQNTSKENGAQGYAVLIGGNSKGTEISLNGCTFDNLHCGVYANQVTEKDAGASVSIDRCTYKGTNYAYSLDDTTPNSYLGGTKFALSNNEGITAEKEIWYNTVYLNGVSLGKVDISTALSKAAAGDTITLSAGTYTLSAPLKITKRVNLVGAGMGKTVLKDTDNSYLVNLSAGDCSNLKFKDMTLQSSGTTTALVKVADGTNCSGLSFDNVAFNGATYGIYLGNDNQSQTSADDIQITDCVFTGMTYGGIYAQRGNIAVDGTVFKDITSADGTAAGILFDTGYFKDNAYSLRVTDCEFSNITGTTSAAKATGAISITGSGTVEQLVVKDNTFTGNTYDLHIGKTGEVPTIQDREISGNGAMKVFIPDQNAAYYVATFVSDKTIMDTVIADANGKVLMPKMTKNGYTFLGWKSSVDGKVYDAGETVTIYRDTTFTALWLNNWGVIGGIIGGAGESDTFFTDVPGSAWYYDAVKFVYDYDLMDGVGNHKFNPDGTLTRAMIGQVLYNLEGASGAYPSVFTDVADSAWYAKAVNWAAASGIVEGKGNNKFDPNAPITRQEMAAILYRYAELKGYDVSKVDSLNGYTDASKVASWAKEAMGWAVENYVINGKGASRLDPTGTATRAQVAQILMNFCNNVL